MWRTQGAVPAGQLTYFDMERAMSENTNETKSPMIQELQGIIDELPPMAKKLPGFVKVIKFVGKVVRRQDRLEARVDALEQQKNDATN